MSKGRKSRKNTISRWKSEQKTEENQEKPKRILHSKKKSPVLKSQEPDKMHDARKKIRKTGRKTKTKPLRQILVRF